MPIKKNKTSSNRPKISRANKKVGKAPGTVTYLGYREKTDSVVHIINYDEHSFDESYPNTMEGLLNLKQEKQTTWIDVVGINDEKFIENLGKNLGLNSLLLEDAVNTEQRPKIDEYDHHIFGVFKMLYLDHDKVLVSEHVALVLFEDSVLVFQELEEDVFDGVRSRIKADASRIRQKGADYLFFALIDAIIDNYFFVLENINSKIENLEEEVYNNPSPDIAQQIQKLKKEVLKVRRFVFPVRDLLGRLLDSESDLITKDTKLYLRDALDHCIEINESLQIYREMSMSLMEMYMSNMSNKMNEVMKVLTIMASIFIPLTFIAGIYGMNFDHMPELHHKNGYFIVWGVMIALFVGMMMYFKRKKWL
ncbi:MAG: magnesium/cobalt transporter CorA [Maribacter sp.]